MTQVGYVYSLGVTIDPSLSWNLHVSNVMSRVRPHVVSFALSLVIVCALYTA